MKYVHKVIFGDRDKWLMKLQISSAQDKINENVFYYV